MREMIVNQQSNDLASGIRDGYTLLGLAQDWLRQGNPVVAIELLVPALASPQADRDKELRARIHKESGRARMMQTDWDNADLHYQEAQRLFVELENWAGAAMCARNRANMLFQKGQYHESEDLCEQALEWVSEMNDYQIRATILNTMGAIKSATGKLRESIKIFKLCLADFQSAGNSLRQGYVLLNIGLTQNDLGDSPQAIESLNQALSIALQERDLHLVEICYQNIAKCYLSQKEISLARSVSETARKILPGLSSQSLEAELNLIDCRILRTAGDIDRAAELLDITHKMAVEHKLTALEADALFEQGLLERELGNTQRAVAKLDAAINQYRLVGIDKGLQEAIHVLEQLNRGSNG